jgi:hypothetical protein
MEEETIDLKCPHCSKVHKYRLSIQRSHFLFGKSGNTRRFRRLFTCPNEEKDFETMLEMKEDDRGTITKVDIVGIVDDEKEAKKNSAK